jgi:hypothetical protein
MAGKIVAGYQAVMQQKDIERRQTLFIFKFSIERSFLSKSENIFQKLHRYYQVLN